MTYIKQAPALVGGPIVLPRVGGGNYYQGSVGLSAVATSGNGNMRLCPVYIGVDCSIEALFAEFTVAGDAASLFATCVYGDDGAGMPKSLLVTGPTISTGTGNAGTVTTGGTPGIYAGAVTAVPITAGLYWIGGAVQGVSSVQPTLRVGTYGTPSLGSTSLPALNTVGTCYYQSGVTGTLPGTFSLTGLSTPCPRVGFRIV